MDRRLDLDRWRRIRLPNGRSIEVLSFTRDDVGEQMHVCRDCSSQLVQPTRWRESGDEHWEVTLRCPECEGLATRVYSQQTAERFDAELDRGTAAMARELRRLAHENMSDDIDRFAAALHEGLILPEDF